TSDCHALTDDSDTQTPTEGVALTDDTVATFTNTANPSNPASDFGAVISWGDGASSAGVVTGNGSGTYVVTGSHTYADEGTGVLSVTLTDDSPGTASLTVTSTVTVTENDTLAATGLGVT